MFYNIGRRIRIGQPVALGMIVTKVRISAGTNCDNFNRVLESGIPFSNIIELPTTIVASHVKITVLVSML
jgi:hypothetical protein